MPQIINTNISALNAQRNLNVSQNSLSTSLQRLSSGLRINSAKDDAAGLAISARMTGQLRGSQQAVRNSNDGVSLAQTAEGAMAQMEDMLQRIRELAVQSSNATNTATDRAALNNEVVQLAAELDRLAQQAQFNGQTLLNGSFGASAFQVGANAGQTITVGMTNLSTTQYGNNKVGVTSFDGLSGIASPGVSGATVGAQSGLFTPTGSGGMSVTLSGPTATNTVTISSGADESARAIANRINAAGTGIRATAKTEATIIVGASKSYTLNVTGGNGAATISFSVGATVDATGLASAVAAFNDKAAQTGITARVNSTGLGIILTSADGSNITLGAATATQNASGSIQFSGHLAGATLLAGASGAVSVGGRVQLDAEKAFSVSLSASGALTLSGVFSLNATSTSVSTLQAVNTLNVTTVAGADSALRIAESALAAVTSARATLGAIQSRFASTIASLENSVENLAASRSRILDADFAQETTNLSRSQILQQAGVAALAQANALPNNVLALLQ